MTTQHTPGPWNARGLDVRKKNALICVLGIEAGIKQEENEQLANARLIAAAPDLLAALGAAQWMLERDFIDEQKRGVLEKVNAAIAKATQQE